MKKISPKFKTYLERLKEVAPLPDAYKTLSVRLVSPKTLNNKDEEIWGECETDVKEGTCHIRISEDFKGENLKEVIQKYILDHEWAHARADYIVETLKKAGLVYEAEFLQDHGLLWAMCYGHIYQNMAGTL